MKRILALVASAGLLSGAAFAASPWDGTYLFEQSIKTDSAGLKLVVNHKLTLSPDGCRIEAEGYQTAEKILCTATPSGDKLEVFFVSYDDAQNDKEHVRNYEPNQKLFTLERKGDAVTTQWAGYSVNNKTFGMASGGQTFKKQM